MNESSTTAILAALHVILADMIFNPIHSRDPSETANIIRVHEMIRKELIKIAERGSES